MEETWSSFTYTSSSSQASWCLSSSGEKVNGTDSARLDSPGRFCEVRLLLLAIALPFSCCELPRKEMVLRSPWKCKNDCLRVPTLVAIVSQMYQNVSFFIYAALVQQGFHLLQTQAHAPLDRAERDMQHL